MAETLLKSAISNLPLPKFIVEGIDHWRFLNWLFVGYYWALLYDLGQESPVNYANLPHQPLPGWYQKNFTQVINLPSTNNIFVNNDLFQNYSSYLLESILPLLGLPLPEFAPLDDRNYLQPQSTTFIRSYSCELRQPKAPFTAIADIVPPVYVFVTGLLSLIIFFAAIAERKRTPTSPSREFEG